MKWFINMKIGAKLILSYVLLAVITAAVAAVGILYIRQINANATVMYENMTQPLANLSAVAELFQEVRVNSRDLISATSSSDIQVKAEKIAELRENFGTNVAEYEAKIVSDEMRQIFDEFTQTRTAYIAGLDQVIELAKSNRDEEATALMNGDMKTAAQTEQAAIDKMVSMKVEDANKKNAQNVAMAQTATIAMLIIMGISVFVAILLGLFLSRIISNPVGMMLKTAEKIAEGDLDVEINYEGKDELGQLAQAFKRMSDYLNDVMTNISISSDQVAVGATQVSSSSQALSQGATEQASSVEELTASIEQISAQTLQNAENAGRANEIALSSKADAVTGNDHMQGMLKAMDEINEASASISKIIKVIDDIAFQTNILALNAAVEAARAGQHGKGFAVVAEEVRNLAAKSANAAKETTALIEGSIKKSEGGTKIASETAVSLTKIVEGVSKAADLVGQIATASHEQSAGIAQINKAIQQVSEVIQTNSATSEESAAASEELSGQADMLKEQISRFKLKKHAGSHSYTESRSDEGRDSKPKKAEKKADAASKKAVPDLSIELGEQDFGKYA